MEIKNGKLLSVTDADIDKNGKLIIPNSVTSIGIYFAWGCTSLKSIIIPNSVTSIGSDFAWGCTSLTFLKIGQKKLSVMNVDGSCFVIESAKTIKGINVYAGYNLIGLDKKILNKEHCFVAEKGSLYAHGLTEEKAIEDLRFKRVSEKLKHSPIKKNTLITINHYRLVTGSCEMGCRSWMVANGIKDENIKAVDLLPILKKTNAYGLEKFLKLVDWN